RKDGFSLGGRVRVCLLRGLERWRWCWLEHGSRHELVGNLDGECGFGGFIESDPHVSQFTFCGGARRNRNRDGYEVPIQVRFLQLITEAGNEFGGDGEAACFAFAVANGDGE